MTCCDRDVIGVEVRGLYDGVLFWQCACGRKVHRFPVDHYLRAKADRYAQQFGLNIEERP